MKQMTLSTLAFLTFTFGFTEVAVAQDPRCPLLNDMITSSNSSGPRDLRTRGTSGDSVISGDLERIVVKAILRGLSARDTLFADKVIIGPKIGATGLPTPDFVPGEFKERQIPFSLYDRWLVSSTPDELSSHITFLKKGGAEETEIHQLVADQCLLTIDYALNHLEVFCDQLNVSNISVSKRNTEIHTMFSSSFRCADLRN